MPEKGAKNAEGFNSELQKAPAIKSMRTETILAALPLLIFQSLEVRLKNFLRKRRISFSSACTTGENVIQLFLNLLFKCNKSKLEQKVCHHVG